MHPLSKTALRDNFRQLRRSLSAESREHAARQISQLWQDSARTEVNIGSYLATPNECPTDALHTLCWQQAKRIFIPLISQPGQWAELTPTSALTKTPLGIFEPIHDHAIATDCLDILLLPLLAIDQQGYRLGYGGGFYDQLLANCPKKPLLIGLGFHRQLVAILPHDPWDIPVDGFLSENGWLFF